VASDVVSFSWRVVGSGYTWIRKEFYELEAEVSNGSAWALRDSTEIRDDRADSHYDPLKEYPGLFRDFAQLNPDDREAIRAFANRYGKLGIARPLKWKEPGQPDKSWPGAWVELHDDWKQQIHGMQAAVRIWDMIQKRDAIGLSHFLRWKNVGRVESESWWYDTHHDVREGDPVPERRVSEPIQPVLDLLKPDDVFTPAMFLVQRWVNSHLEGHVSPCLLYDLRLKSQVLRIVPSDLLGAMWLQLAEAIAGHKEFRACKSCGKWIEISHLQADNRTRRREFCSDACKLRDYRQRKDRARLLKSEGQSTREIAKELHTNEQTIKNWLKKLKEK
jgi:hypothetical protein